MVRYTLISSSFSKPPPSSLTILLSMTSPNTLLSAVWDSSLSKPRPTVSHCPYPLGPAPKADFEDEDIVDEAIQQFRANILFKNYDVRGPADKTLIFLTVFIQKLLETVAKK